jgi:glycosyltransferase involved in cell wall biosynthesis
MITGLGTGLAEAPGFGGRIRKALAMQIYRLGLKDASAVLFQNPDNRAFFNANGLVGEKNRQVLIDGSGVNLAHFAPSPPDMSRPTFLMISRLLIDKGVREYAKAARLVKADHPKARFLLVGPTDKNPMALPKAELDGWVKKGVIEYLDAADDVRPSLRSCTTYVLPSYHEGTPRSTLEAMAIGRAVITTDVPGCRETVRHGENGLLVPAYDADALADAMRTLILAPERVPAMGLASRRLVEERFDVHKVNRKILDTLGIAWPEDDLLSRRAS